MDGRRVKNGRWIQELLVLSLVEETLLRVERDLALSRGVTLQFTASKKLGYVFYIGT